MHHTDAEKRIKNPVKHLRWSFFTKIVHSHKLLTIFTKTQSYMFDRVLNRPLIFGAALTEPFPNGFVLKSVLSNKIRS